MWFLRHAPSKFLRQLLFNQLTRPLLLGSRLRLLRTYIVVQNRRGIWIGVLHYTITMGRWADEQLVSNG